MSNRTGVRSVLAGICLCLTSAVSAQLAVTDLDKAWLDDVRLAQKFQREGKPEVAEELLARALRTAEKIGKDSLPVAACLNALAILYQSQQNYSGAEPLYKGALAIVEEKLGADDPAVDVLHKNVQKNLGGLYREQGRLLDSLEHYRAALKITEAQLPAGDLGLVEPLRTLAELELRLGRFDEASVVQERVLTILERGAGVDHPDTIKCLNDLGVIHVTAGRFDEAEQWILQAITSGEAAWGPDDPRLARSYVYQAGIWRQRLQLAEAEELLGRTIVISGMGEEPENAELAMALNNLAQLQIAQQYYSEAEGLFERSIHVWARVAGLEDPEVGTGLYNLGSFYRGQERYQEAEAVFKRALHILESQLGPADPRVKQAASAHAEMLRALGREPGSEEGQRTDAATTAETPQRSP